MVIKNLRCESCDSTQTYNRIRKNERVCKACGHIQNLKTKGEQQAELLSKVSAQASNKTSNDDILGEAIDSVDGKKDDCGRAENDDLKNDGGVN